MTNSKKIALTTLGCKVNQFESAAFLSRFREQGHTLVPFTQEADVYIINTCAVTSKAGAQSRHMIRRALRNKAGARVIVTGCYAQVSPEEIEAIGGENVCLVGNDHKEILTAIALGEEIGDLPGYPGDIRLKKTICSLPASYFPGRTRAFLKVQDGCDSFCSYCIVPFSRGRSRSLEPAAVIGQLQTFVAAGYKEIVITGIHAGAYGRDLVPPASLLSLLKEIAAGDFPARYRISSLEPTEITEELLEFIAAEPQFVPHLHIPLQSGDDGVLKKMNRKYSSSDFQQVIQLSHRILPEAAIGVDVMVGFPGEDEGAFRNSLELLESLPVTYLHVFPYSRRPGTAAARMKNQISSKVKEERVALLKELDHKKRSSFFNRFVGSTRQVLTESRKNAFRLMKGFTDNYIPVYFACREDAGNELVPVTIERVVDVNVFGTRKTGNPHCSNCNRLSAENPE